VDVRILIAEDERINQLYMSHLLSSAGHEVVLAGDGADALARLAERPCDVVLMDLQMPKVDGIEAARRIRAGEAGDDVADVPIVALTAYNSDQDRRAQSDAGFDDFVDKPLDERRLLNLIAELGAGRTS
jgi:CheY-like chemotaxis protein